MRALEPTRLVDLESGLWAVDGFQPVAGVLDPRTGVIRRVVSWPELPPPPCSDWEPRTVLGDGDSLWVQPQYLGLVARIDATGVVARVEVGRMRLVAAGGGAAWCAPPEREQLIVRGHDDRRLAAPLRRGVLRRVGRDGELADVATPAPVVMAFGAPDALWVQVETEPFTLQPLGDGSYDATRGTTWLRLPWDVPVPSELTLQRHAALVGPAPGTPTGTFDDIGWHRGPGQQSPWDGGHARVVAAQLRWYVGWPTGEDSLPVPEPGEVRFVTMAAYDDADELFDAPLAAPQDLTVDRRVEARQLRVTAYDLSGRQVHDLDLGQGSVNCVEPLAEGIALAVHRPGPASGRPLVEVVRIDAATGRITVLLRGGSLDIATAGWPVGERPANAEKYVQEQLRRCAGFADYWQDSRHEGRSRPLARGMAEVDAQVVGQWPDAELRVTFRLAGLPGLLLRRRWPLFDEFGRVEDLEYFDIHLMEDVETWQLPPATLAVDGVLDI